MTPEENYHLRRSHLHHGPADRTDGCRAERRRRDRSRPRGRRRLFLAAPLLLLSAFPAQGETLRLSLREAVGRALSDGTAARIASERIDQSRFQARVAGSALLPQAGIQAAETNQSINFQQFGFTAAGFPLVIPPFSFFNAQAQIALEIVDMAARQRYEAAREGVVVSMAERERTENDVTAAVATLYVAMQRTEASVEAARANVDLFEKLYRLADDQREAGIATKLDSTRAEVALARQRQALLVAENRRETARLALLHAAGADQSSEVVLTDPLVERGEAVPTAEEALRLAREQRPELRVLDEELKVAGFATEAARAERLPRLGFQFQGGYSGYHFDNLFWTRSVAALVSVPVFTGGRMAARIAEAQSQARLLQLQRTETERQVEEEVRRALLSWQSARNRVRVARENERLALEELRFARDRFADGVSSSIEVDNAQTSLAAAQEDRISALADEAQARFDLGRATGSIREVVAGS
ncbi:MAG TPA: TolC family protein [Thermoanaerobaculia bacterium]|nr:TolC family protein [Thermoanaerobaculia bacterium]